MKGFIIFSVERPELTRSEVERRLAEVQGAMECKLVKGCYKGTREISLVLSDIRNEPMVEYFCSIFDQESYLRVDANKNAELVYIKDAGNEIEPIGLWQEVGESIAMVQDAYTKIDGRYFVCSRKLFPSKIYKR